MSSGQDDSQQPSTPYVDTGSQLTFPQNSSGDNTSSGSEPAAADTAPRNIADATVAINGKLDAVYDFLLKMFDNGDASPIVASAVIKLRREFNKFTGAL